jgi:hypothetical protein
MKELNIQPSELDNMHPLRKLRLGLYLEQYQLYQKQLLEESRQGYGTRNKEDIKIEHPKIEEYIKNKNLEIYGTTNVDRMSYIPKYNKKKK